MPLCCPSVNNQRFALRPHLPLSRLSSLQSTGSSALIRDGFPTTGGIVSSGMSGLPSYGADSLNSQALPSLNIELPGIPGLLCQLVNRYRYHHQQLPPRVAQDVCAKVGAASDQVARQPILLAVDSSTGNQTTRLWTALPFTKLVPFFPALNPLSAYGRRPLAVERMSTLLVFNVARFAAGRQFSTLSTFSIHSVPGVPKFLGRVQTRALTLPGGPSQITLSRAEQLANGNPQNPYAQERFYDLLLRAGYPQVIADRHQSGNYASNKACNDKYLQAVEKLAQMDDTSLIMDGTGAYAAGRSGIASEKMQAVGQAVAARARGGNISAAQGKAGTGDKDNPIYVVVDESIGGAIFKWIKFILYFVLVGYIALVFLTLAVEATTMFKKVGGPKSNEAQSAHQTVRFSDVHGCDEAKEELQELVEFLKNPAQFSTLGGKLPKGVLLVGPPGTGKTLLARAVAGEAGVPFFFMSGSEFDEVYVGVGAKRVRELFAQARAKAPAIVFIDELDAIGGKRNERDAAYVKQTLNQLLVDLDGFAQNSGVIFLAATNFPQMLDKALIRPGRFDRNINVPLPDVRGRIDIIKHHIKVIKIGPNVDLSLLARATPGFSGAELENMVNQAAVRASREKATSVRMEDFDWAKDKIMMGAERRSAVIPMKEREMTAYHESGHTLVGLYTEGHSPVYKVTIMPRGQALGLTAVLPEGDQLSITRKQLLANIDSALGGKIAEELVYGPENVTSGCSSVCTALILKCSNSGAYSLCRTSAPLHATHA